jgi:hypothetical protein
MAGSAVATAQSTDILMRFLRGDLRRVAVVTVIVVVAAVALGVLLR